MGKKKVKNKFSNLRDSFQLFLNIFSEGQFTGFYNFYEML